jgi:hypothetical protein
MQVLRTDTAKRQERACFTAIVLAAIVASAALWTLSSGRAPHQTEQISSPAKTSGHMLIPLGAAGGNGDEIDHAIARDSRSHTVKQSSEQPKTGAAVDAIYRFGSGRATGKTARIMI